MGGGQNVTEKNRSKNVKLNLSSYSSDTKGSVCRVFFKIDSFSKAKGIRFIKQIAKENEEVKLIVTGGGYFRIKLPSSYKHDGSNDLNKVWKKWVEGEISIINKLIKKEKIRIPILLGIDFINKQNSAQPIQLAVSFHKGKFKFVSKRYPTSNEFVISRWEYEKGSILKVKGIGNVVPLVCNDGVIWAGRSEKILKNGSEKMKKSGELKKEIRKKVPKLLVDLIHGISSEKEGRSFSSSAKSYNEKNKNKSLFVGIFGSKRSVFLRQLATSKKIPNKLKMMSSEMTLKLKDYYIY